LLDAGGTSALNLLMLILIATAACLVCYGVNNVDYLREKEEARGSVVGSLLRRSTVEKEGGLI